MARTVDPAAYAVRRGEILDAAQRLLIAKGYAQMSIQDVLGDLGISRGALYHYFGSKQALLAGVVERTAETIRAQLEPETHAEGRDPLAKLGRMFAALAGWKTGHRTGLVALLEVWQSDHNALLRQRTRAITTERLAPLFGQVIEQGVGEGVFTVPVPGNFGRVLVDLIHDLNGRLAELFLASEPVNSESAQITLDTIDRTVTSYTAAIERMLGVPSGAITLVEPSILHAWFDPNSDKKDSI
ncbi:TetR/AcrR family transcriptional regulator [Nocardia sp. BMG51109]|uniref:TetR/AcrR family transcriptional regulator n=1 Tax=Nocardia sp. BMG51109 TaxID=1056816 RepID=UPI000465C447|nr:TetR/AcrR family transcriptional regulator [Nocardia sp. BMG51109]